MLDRFLLDAPIGLATGHVRHDGEVEHRRRRRHDPFERAAVPRVAGVIAQGVAAADGDDELRNLAADADEDQNGAAAGEDHPGAPGRNVIVLHAARHALEPEHVERHEGDVEASHPEPEGGLAEPLVELEAERLREPIGVAGERAEQHAADDHVVEVSDQKKRIVQHEIGGRHRQQHARHAPDHERDHEGERPEHRHLEAHAPAPHGEEPVEDLHAGGDGDDHRHDAEEGVHIGSRAHGEEVVQPHHEGEDADPHGGDHHRAIAEQWLGGEGRDHLGIDAEGRQDEDVNLRVPPGPDQVHVHHRVAAEIGREEVEPEIAVEQQHREGRSEDRERRYDQQVRCERGPAEDRHAREGHAGRADLQDRGHEVYAGHQCPGA